MLHRRRGLAEFVLVVVEAVAMVTLMAVAVVIVMSESGFRAAERLRSGIGWMGVGLG